MKTSTIMLAAKQARLKLAVRGAVQGVGFRPFVYRLATELGLRGWVNNSPQGVFIEAEGGRELLEQFLLRLETERPPRSFIQSLESSWLDAVGYTDFEIRDSETIGDKTALVLPDIATCPACLREIFDPANRRFRYPFTNCTNCGPRFSIIESLPYDRANTSMKSFAMCPQCQAEYDDPANRRFHAQPNACPVCGPVLEFWERGAVVSPTPKQALARNHTALLVAAAAIRRGQILAVKGIGGFHLIADASNERAVCLLRKRKHREEKPFALMFPSLESVKMCCEVSTLEERLLRSPEAPIVLLKRRSGVVCEDVAPSNPNLGAMLPSNPLHHLLMAELGFPVVATSGNLSDEPICTDEHEALERLHNVADAFLVHNRPIVRHVDDSIVRVMLNREMILRRARGYSPLPIQIQNSKFKIQNVLAVGAHLKNSVALAVGEQVFLSQHIGDLETEQANTAFCRVIGDFEKLYDAKPAIIAADLHPDYLSTKFAEELAGRASAECSGDGTLERRIVVEPPGKAVSRPACHHSPKLIGVQHHIAHVLSCIAENEIELPAVGVAWDGTGCGTDGTIWGGDFFLVTEEKVERVARLRPFRLPGGDAAVKEPRRVAVGLLHELFGDELLRCDNLPALKTFSTFELQAMIKILSRKLNSPLCSSVGRLFDAVASLVGVRHQTRFEGQAAMELEFALDGVRTEKTYPLPLMPCGVCPALDWSRMIEMILLDIKRGVSIGEISGRFHNTLAEAVVTVARDAGARRVALSGGCFQNRYLTERTVARLRDEGFQPYWHQRVPTNDGGIALGQIVAARREIAARSAVVCDSTSRSNLDSATITESATRCGWSDGHSRAPVQQITHLASP
jgi:hydrogenase maturation protein HypF